MGMAAISRENEFMAPSMFIVKNRGRSTEENTNVGATFLKGLVN